MIPLGVAATIYVMPPVVSVPGVFGPTGQFMVSFNPLMPTLSGATLYFHSAEMLLFAGGLQVSNGLELIFVN